MAGKKLHKRAKGSKPRPFSRNGYQDEDIIPLSFDTETDGLGGPIQCITACDWKRDHYLCGDTMVAEFFAILAQYPYPFVWFAHHAQYDWRYFMEHIRVNNIPCDISMRTETDIYQIKLFLNEETIVMRDSMAIFPGTLRNFADSFTPDIPKGHIDFEGGVRFDKDNADHQAYAMRDTRILREGLPRFNALLSKHFGVTIGHTTAGTAMKAWQASLTEGEFYNASMHGEEEDFIRSAYFGGLVFLTRTNKVYGAQTFDINSSYPARMCEDGVPHGQRIAATDFRVCNPGIFRVLVRAPADLIIPILPRRDKRGHMRWSGGTFETTVTNRELIFAEQHGYKILDVHEGVVWEETAFPFNAFIEKCKTIRRDFKGKPEETLAKLMQNSLYGKFGSRRERLTVFQASEDNPTLDALPLDDAGFWWIKKEFSEDLRCIPAWAVFITAHARLKLLRTAYDVGVENVLYGDTDSLTVMQGHGHCFDQGDEYGQWKLEKTWAEFRAIGAKVYSGILDDGRYKGAAKGLPKKKMHDEQWRALLAGDRVTVDYETLPALRVAMKRGKVERAKPVSRISSDIANAGNWELHGDFIRPKLAPLTEEKTS